MKIKVSYEIDAQFELVYRCFMYLVTFSKEDRKVHLPLKVEVIARAEKLLRQYGVLGVEKNAEEENRFIEAEHRRLCKEFGMDYDQTMAQVSSGFHEMNF